jgi:hypothetical protein
MTQYLNVTGSAADTAADAVVGCRVDRATDVMGASENLFTVSGGNILLTAFYGEIMVAIDTVNVYHIDFNPTAGVTTVLGTNTGALNGYVAGRMFYLPAVGGALAVTAAGGACPIDIAPTIILPPGVMVLTGTNALTLGSVRWSLWYIAVDPGAFVVAS